MDRGPMALFGAIVAIGLGPAMWLGVQFGQATLLPGQPPAVTSVQNNVEAPPGGAGAGDDPTEAEAIRPEPKANTGPLTSTRNARPVTTRTTKSPSASPKTSAPVEESTTPSTPGGDEESEPPAESTTPPADPPTGDNGGEDDETPAEPPATEADPQPVTAGTALT